MRSRTAIAFDGFESLGFSGGFGWTGAWLTSGNVQMRAYKNGPHTGAAHVRLRQSSGYLERTVDLSGASDVVLNVWTKVNSFETGDEAYVKVNDGSGWTVVATMTKADGKHWRSHEIDLSGFSMVANFRIAIDAEMGDNKDRLYVDDIEIVGVR